MGHCNFEMKQDSNTKLSEKHIDSKPKEKVKNNTNENIKNIVLGQGRKVDDATFHPVQKNTMNIGNKGTTYQIAL